ncbi:MAG: hypothetical protein IIT64_03445, partial [Bacteroidaceae bacterium]|nr:hypothetical protein [Bacteroidaceae bacterium]
NGIFGLGDVPAVDIKSEADIEYEEKCPFAKYVVDSPVLIDKDGKSMHRTAMFARHSKIAAST